MKQPAVYILASERNGTLYTGVTSDLVARTWQHREHVVDGFTNDTRSRYWYGMSCMVPWMQRFFGKNRSRSGTGRGSCV